MKTSAPIPAARVGAVVPPPPQRKALAFAILCLGCFIAFLDIQIVSASIGEIGGGLSASPDDMSWVQTSYLIGDIIVIPLAAWLSRVLSTRWLVTIGATGFTLASMLCGTAWDIRSMIVFRALQGLFGGVMIPTAFTAAVVLFAGKQKAVAASCVSAAAGLAPTLGPVIGGWITDDWSWHWVFYINIVPGMAVAVLAPVFVKLDEPDLMLLKGRRLPRHDPDGGLSRLSGLCPRRGSALGVAFRRHHRNVCLDCRIRRRRLRRPQPDLCPSDH